MSPLSRAAAARLPSPLAAIDSSAEGFQSMKRERWRDTHPASGGPLLAGGAAALALDPLGIAAGEAAHLQF